MTRKLNGQLRERIVHNASKDTFEAHWEELRQRENELAMAVYEDTLPKKHRDQLNALPEGYAYEAFRIFATFGGTYDKLEFTSTVRVPYNKHCGAWAAYDGTHALSEAFFDLKNAKETLTGQQRELEAKLKALVNSVGTTAKLIEVWPEAVSYIPEYTPPIQTLPTVLMADIQSAITSFKKAA